MLRRDEVLSLSGFAGLNIVGLWSTVLEPTLQAIVLIAAVAGSYYLARLRYLEYKMKKLEMQEVLKHLADDQKER